MRWNVMKTMEISRGMFLTILAISVCIQPAFATESATKYYESSNNEKHSEPGEDLSETFSVSSASDANNTENIENSSSFNTATEDQMGTTDSSHNDNKITTNITTTIAPTISVSSQTTSLAPHPTDPTEIPPYKLNQDHLLCLCDLHMRFCDTNCCCDSDCSDAEKNVFSTCEDSHIYDAKNPGQKESSCFRTNIFYTHSTPYRLERSQKGMFCVIVDNNRDQTDFQLPKGGLEKRIRKATSKYSWSSLRTSVQLDRNASFYKYGNVLLCIKSSESSEEIISYSLPAAYNGKLCSVKKPVKFLQDSQTSCLVRVLNLNDQCEKLEQLNANYYTEGQVILSSPSEPNAEEREFRKALCHRTPKELKCEEESKIPIPHKDELMCKNILHSMNITIIHNGVKGIQKVIAKSELKDYPLGTKEIHQEFRVNFLWMNVTNDTVEEIDINISDWPRSGNPGYLVGKPVIMGEKVHVEENTNKENGGTAANIETQTEIKTPGSDHKNPVIVLSKDPTQWMTVLNPGYCDVSLQNPKRRSVVFGLSHSTVCQVKATIQKYCVDLKLALGRILLGVEHPEDFMKQQKHVAAFGNANPTAPSEWVFVHLENFAFNKLPKSRVDQPPSSSLVISGCDGIVSSLHIQIAFAYVGSVDFPQAKILNVVYEFGESYSIPKQTACTLCRGQNDLEINVQTVVTFIDITSRPLTRMAKWPIVSIKLPSDFFYPFTSPSLSSGCAKSLYMVSQSVSIVLFLLFIVCNSVYFM